MPKGISLLFPGSRCPSCLHKLGLFENLPVVGWISLKGKCHYCKTAIPFRYLWVEILTGGLHFFAIAFAMVSSHPVHYFLICSAVLSWAILLSLIDAEHKYLPDLLTLGPLLFLILYQSDWQSQPFAAPMMDFFLLAVLLLIPQFLFDLIRSLLRTLGGERSEMLLLKVTQRFLRDDGTLKVPPSALIILPFLVTAFWFYPSLDSPTQQHHWLGFGVALFFLMASQKLSYVFLKAQGLGLGDVKLGALLGWILGWPGFLFTLGLACTTALSFFILTGGLRGKSKELPFGPFLLWAGIFTYFLGQSIPFQL